MSFKIFWHFSIEMRRIHPLQANIKVYFEFIELRLLNQIEYLDPV